MIHVERLPAPQTLAGPDSKGGRETARWKAYYKKKLKKKPGKFSAYNESEVQLVLRNMFHNKCAYCEREIPGGDVEHFRPKNAVIRDDGTRLPQGYWWLAADWDNLLWSCVNCNQKRKVELHGEEGLFTVGKGASFPVANSVVVSSPGDETLETPLLLNPVQDFPEKHMRVKTEDNKLDKGCLQAVELGNGAIDKKGETTIKLLGLNNVVTIKQRQELLELIRERMRRIEKLSAKLERSAARAGREELKAEKEEEITKLMGHLEPDEPYLMLARQVILPFMRQQQMRGIVKMIQQLNNLGPGAERDHLKVAMKEELKKLGAHLAPGQPDLEAAQRDILPFMEKLMGK